MVEEKKKKTMVSHQGDMKKSLELKDKQTKASWRYVFSCGRC
jgi:hypothetical protein